MNDRTRRRLMITAGGVALVAACAFGLSWWTTRRFMIETDDAYVRADVVTVAPRVAGQVMQVTVADNQRVAAGDVLARLDDRDGRLKVEQAEGALASAQADVAAQQAHEANLDAMAQQQHSVIAEKDAATVARMADAHLAALQDARQSTLSRQQVTSTQMVQTAQADAARTAAALAQARAAAATARAELPVLTTQRNGANAALDKARGAVRQAQAALAAARLDLERTVIRAPVAGRVGQRTLRVGHYADVGEPLMALVPAETYVVANYKETQMHGIRPGQPVRVEVDAVGVLRGHVDSFAPASGAQFALLPPDNATGNFTKIVQRVPLRIRLDPGQNLADLRPGMSVETSVDTRR